MDDYSYWDLSLWIGVSLLYILPIGINFRRCIKNKRKLVPSILLSIFYPTTFWIAIATWFIGLMFSITLLGKVLPEWIAVTLSFIVVGGGLMWPIGRFQDIWGNLMDNFCDRGIYSIKSIPPDEK